MRKNFITNAFWDVIIVILSFIICVWIKPGANKVYYDRYLDSFILFVFIWLLVSISFNKYDNSSINTLQEYLKKYLKCNLVVFFVMTSMIYLFQSFGYSRFIVLGTVGLATLSEVLLGSFHFLILNAKVKSDDSISRSNHLHQESSPLGGIALVQGRRIPYKYDFKLRADYLKMEIGEEAYRYIVNYAAIDSPNTLIIASTTRFNIDAQIQKRFECILNVKRINDFRYINKYFESVNAKLSVGGLFIDYFESKNLRKKRILRKYPAGFNYVYYSLDFIVKRVFPKFGLTKKLYFLLTRGENRVLSKAEAFGRLYSCGFEVLDEKTIGNYLYFVAIKVKEPLFPKNPSYGPMVALERIGKDGKTIKVYKMRTMHPFAEYLQEYIYKRAGLQEGGKFKNDFRVTTLGKIMRKFWLDELPMVINLFKGDLKLVGIRPLSRQYFKLYTLELQKLRIKSKPGLIPPFYVDHPKTLDEIIESELRYLKSYEKHPFRTDWVYFWKAFYNIVFRRYRSK